MSTKLVEEEIRRFLSSDETEVACITGKWGVGKTFTWNKHLNEAKMHNRIALKRYSYVSLFGLNSLEDFKTAIFQNIVQTSEMGEPSLATLCKNTAALTEGLGRKAAWFGRMIPGVKDYLTGFGPALFLTVQSTIICVDDIERRGTKLSVRDVMGLASELKERKNCKVFFILNDEALQDDARRDFETYYEKVVDISLNFAPTAADCARIAISTDSQSGRYLAESCVSLGISNIRVIKKIERAVRKIEPLLKGLDEDVLKQVVKTLSLLAWCVHEPIRAPSLEYLKARTPAKLFGLSKGEEIPEKEASWNALLEAYGFAFVDEFDLILLDGIQNGFFDRELVEVHVRELDRSVRAQKQGASFTEAWRAYHDSFDNNTDEVIDAIYKSFNSNVRSISPLNLGGTVSLFRGLHRDDLADEIIATYVTVHGEDRDLFDLSKYPFASNVKDLHVVQAFREKYATFKDKRDFATVLLSLNQGWNDNTLSYLSATPVEEYRKLLKNTYGTELHKLLNACLFFDSVSNASVPQKEISRRAKEALRQIGQESEINALRVKRFGIDTDDSSDQLEAQ
ncbi:MAG: KAP family NTPase [Acidobacteriia bacterium]|nr:KAP family NTPase [Terriglobia bacterium]